MGISIQGPTIMEQQAFDSDPALLAANNRSSNRMSEEEERIREELEREIERDLEAEIKDEIYRLALRLNRLYQHRKDIHINSKSFSEINICIRMEGGMKVEIKETKKPADISINHGRHGLRNHRRLRLDKKINVTNSMNYIKRKKFDWADTLRSGPQEQSDSVVRNKKVTDPKPKTNNVLSNATKPSPESNSPQHSWK